MRVRIATVMGPLLVVAALVASAALPRAVEAATPACDRACLEGFVDKYLDAVLAHDPSRLPVTRDIKFTENGQKLELGDGLWRTLTAKGSYRMFVTDVQAGQVAFLGSIVEADTPAMLALHLKIEKDRIARVETLVQRSDKSAIGFDKIGYSWKDTIPAAERMSRAELLRVANLYFSGMEKNDGKGEYPFADDCNRIENGQNSTNAPTPEGQTRPDPKTASNYSGQWSCREQFESGLLHFVTRIRDRRYVAVDPERGLVFSFIFFDHSAGDTRTFQTPDGRTVTAGPKQPWTWELAEAFKIDGGRIHQITAIMERVPYGMNSGWSTWEEGLSSKARDATR
ncbi:MAG TPA: hypothetical protein VGO53_08500 [Steroidobacteraceae bacterium]|nr:hypothetical protein [Steroidobacteraceae bacterium]